MEVALPGLADEIAGLFRRYARERARRPEEAHESFDLDEQEPDPEELPIDRAASSVDDAGSSESFASQARIILEERFPHTATGVMKPPAPSRPNPSPKSGRWAFGHDVHSQPFGLQNEQ